MAPRLRSAVMRFDALPEPVMRVLFLALPVDERARAACVCRSWRAFLADVSLWQVLDLTPAGGVAAERVTENLVRCAVRRAAGQLRELSTRALSIALLVAVFRSDGAELQQVSTDRWLPIQELEAVLAAAPRLQLLSTGVSGASTDLLPVLRNDPPYGPLRVSVLETFDFDRPPAAVLVALAAAIAAHESLDGLQLVEGHFARGLNALVDAAAQRRVSFLSIGFGCTLDAESVHALARVLQRGSLTKLQVYCPDFPPAQEESWPVLCAALRACPTLTQLNLRLEPLDEISRHDFTELVDAAAALPALSPLDLWRTDLEDPEDAGHALGRLLRANLPSLRTLNVYACGLGDEGLAPLLDGLTANTHLRELDCRNNDLSEEFKQDRLDPALAELAARGEHDA